MVNYTYKGSRINFDIRIHIREIEMEANYILDRLEIEYLKMISTGISHSEAVKTIIGWVNNNTDFYATFTNKLKKMTREMAKELVAKPTKAYAEDNPEIKFFWVLGEVKTKHCNDCLRLSKMKPRTVDEWRSLGYGLPREGKTECSYGCQCMLEPIK